ncbi:MAG TPA: hypothetical protein VLB80_00835 [Candidatus Babeliales bacterium]|nr:hypothetical protein [Candidatus Babeliales bacterium]
MKKLLFIIAIMMGIAHESSAMILKNENGQYRLALYSDPCCNTVKPSPALPLIKLHYDKWFLFFSKQTMVPAWSHVTEEVNRQGGGKALKSKILDKNEQFDGAIRKIGNPKMTYSYDDKGNILKRQKSSIDKKNITTAKTRLNQWYQILKEKQPNGGISKSSYNDHKEYYESYYLHQNLIAEIKNNDSVALNIWYAFFKNKDLEWAKGLENDYKALINTANSHKKINNKNSEGLKEINNAENQAFVEHRESLYMLKAVMQKNLENTFILTMLKAVMQKNLENAFILTMPINTIKKYQESIKTLDDEIQNFEQSINRYAFTRSCVPNGGYLIPIKYINELASDFKKNITTDTNKKNINYYYKVDDLKSKLQDQIKNNDEDAVLLKDTTDQLILQLNNKINKDRTEATKNNIYYIEKTKVDGVVSTLKSNISTPKKNKNKKDILYYQLREARQQINLSDDTTRC